MRFLQHREANTGLTMDFLSTEPSADAALVSECLSEPCEQNLSSRYESPLHLTDFGQPRLSKPGMPLMTWCCCPSCQRHHHPGNFNRHLCAIYLTTFRHISALRCSETSVAVLSHTHLAHQALFRVRALDRVAELASSFPSIKREKEPSICSLCRQSAHQDLFASSLTLHVRTDAFEKARIPSDQVSVTSISIPCIS